MATYGKLENLTRELIFAHESLRGEIGKVSRVGPEGTGHGTCVSPRS